MSSRDARGGRPLLPGLSGEARRREIEYEIAAAQSVFPRSEDFGVHDPIDPRDTRPRLCQWIEEIQSELALLRGPRRYTVRP